MAIFTAQAVANALTALGVKTGDRIGTLAWNGYRHMELYYGVSARAPAHINPRLFLNRSSVANHARISNVLRSDLRAADRKPRRMTSVSVHRDD
jgi:acyl-CoA synthetase (AMP-forming)/AMP-acid ligase II